MKKRYCMDLKFEKAGILFEFKQPEIDEYGRMMWQYNINNGDTYYNAEYVVEKNAIVFSFAKKVNGKNIGGVALLPEDLEKVKALSVKMKTERQIEIDMLINNLISGAKKIEFEIVGFDDKHYQAWVGGLPRYISAQDIMNKATEKFANLDYVPGGVICEFLGNCAKKIYGQDFTWLQLGDKFEIQLSDLLGPYIKDITEKENKEKERLDNLFKLAKETSEPQIINSYSADCNDSREECNVDIVTEYAMPDGTRITKRNHTW